MNHFLAFLRNITCFTSYHNKSQILGCVTRYCTKCSDYLRQPIWSFIWGVVFHSRAASLLTVGPGQLMSVRHAPSDRVMKVKKGGVHCCCQLVVASATSLLLSRLGKRIHAWPYIPSLKH